MNPDALPQKTTTDQFFPRDNRLLTLHGPAVDQEDIPPLEVVSLHGQEAVNGLFEYRLRLQTPERALGLAPWRLDPARLLGREISISIPLEGFGPEESPNAFAGPHRARQISGLVAAAGLVDADHRHQTSEITLRPWLYLATLGTNNRIFQDLTAPEIIDAVLADYPYPVVRRLAGSYPRRDICIQRHETDHAFVARLLQEWGINYHFEHTEGVHRLVLSDHNSAFMPFPALQNAIAGGAGAEQEGAVTRHCIQIHPPGHRPGYEYLHAFEPRLQMTSVAWEGRDYDYAHPRADMRSRSGEIAALPPTSLADSATNRPTSAQLPARGRQLRELYNWRGASLASAAGPGNPGGADWSQPGAGREGRPHAPSGGDQTTAASPNLTNPGDGLARIRLEAIVQHRNRSHAAGHIRSVAAGCRFELAGHTHAEANTQHLILSATLTVELPAYESQSLDAGRHWHVNTSLVSQPADIPLRPDNSHHRPVISGVETAVVTGPPGSDIHTDYLGRVKVKFPWDRLGKDDQSSSCWVRVASSFAGNQLGAMQLPRIGQEVLVQYEGGDPDLPVVTGRVYNGLNQPPWTLPGQQALSGFRSRELSGDAAGDKASGAAGDLQSASHDANRGNAASGRSNHLLLDDSAGQIQAQLKSDHQHSSLSLGHITRVEDNAGRKDERGQGFELRTDGHGALRAAMGLILTTHAREAATGGMKDVQEALEALQNALRQSESLADAAGQHLAHDGDDQQSAVQAIRLQNDDLAGDGAALGEMSRPHVLLASTAGVQTTARGDTHQASGGHHIITAGAHASTVAGKSFLVSAAEAVRLFARNAGMRFFAARGDVQVQAQAGNVELRARKTIRLQAKVIELQAEHLVLINGAGSHQRLDAAGILHGTDGGWTVHAATKVFAGPKSLPVQLPPFPQSVCKDCMVKAALQGSPLAQIR